MKKQKRSQKPLEIILRAYVPPKNRSVPKARFKDQGPSNYYLVFDTETTVDTQRLRFGTYQFRKDHELIEAGVFYEQEAFSNSETLLLERYTARHKLKLISKAEFIDRVLFGKAYSLRATIIGFNLPFDISRLAIRHGSARGRLMRGGFTFKLSEQKFNPNIQVRNLSRRAAFIQFAGKAGRFDTRGMRKREKSVPVRRGYFVDLNTLSSSLLSQPFSLGSLAKFLDTSTQKLDVEEHGVELTEKYIQYAVQDVQVTWECYLKLIEKFRSHEFSNKLPSQIMSEASLGKAYLEEMNIQPWRERQPDFPEELIGEIMSAYFGGRSEIHVRRKIVQVAYCDFLSMYPTICSLMNLWKFVIAKGAKWKKSAREIRKLLKSIKLDDLQDRSLWPQLATMVRILPDKDILPVRARYGDGNQQTIASNYLTPEKPLWFTLADVIASKLLTGKTPRILEAISFIPGEPQENLNPVNIAGNSEYRVDPYNDDFFRRLIELRNSIKEKIKNASAEQRPRLNNEQLTLKITANSTSYGNFIELNVEDLKAPENRFCFNFTGEPYRVEIDKTEAPGRYFHPLLGALITGGARLMLAIAETLAVRNGLDWALCDTDSMAIAKPGGVEATFNDRVEIIRNWFDSLNPYFGNSELFKLEDVNFENGDKSGKLVPLYLLAISAKRYVLFNLSENGEVIIRKASAHGLGHLVAPYPEADAPKSIPEPRFPLKTIGVERWQYDLWHQIIRAMIDGHPDQINLAYHPNLDLPAASRYTATTPALLKWFDKFNRLKEPADQIGPFNFMLAFHAWPNCLSKSRSAAADNQIPKPVAPFDRDVRKAAEKCFDRETGEPIKSSSLKTYRELLAQFHLRPESKFENGDFLDNGVLRRRNIKATAFRNIGKESNKWEEKTYLGADEAAELNYGQIKSEIIKKRRGLKILVRRFGERPVAARAGISRAKLKSILTGSTQTQELHPVSLAVDKLKVEESDRQKRSQAVLLLAKKEIAKIGISEFARRSKIDPSNLAKTLNKARPLSQAVMALLLTYFGVV